ncbi:MAG TPA: DNA polymerase/3'-5' exonuclease PolX [Thermoanaerobaculia bacterium]|nr:DNA polymerase/3'-5' exonuclease PolX [Thermoanaerobaculia bacterium]
MDNVEIARTLAEVADILEIQGENTFRIRAYRNAVRTVEVQTVPLGRLVEQGSPLTQLPGIGKEMANHIKEMVTTGTLAYRDELLAQFPRALIEIMRLPGLGPKKARRLWDEMGIDSVEALEAAGKAGRIAALSGFGAKSQEKILAGIQEYRQRSERRLLFDAERYVKPLLAFLQGAPGVERLEAAGSYRRRKETVGDIDLLAAAREGRPVMERFLAYPQIEQVLGSGETKTSVVLGGGLQVDLRVVPPDCYGAALVYFTGSKEHNVKLRRRGVERGFKISEYGVFRVPQAEAAEAADIETPPENAVPIAAATEEEVYAAVGLALIPPELREDCGEIEAAARGPLPRLIEIADLQGDLHMHSTWSDGKSTLEEMVAACAARGYQYMAITDHSKALPMIQGLDAARLKQQWQEIDAIRARHPEILVLKGMEVDILADGTLDLEDEMLAALDWVVISVHSRFELPEEEQTARVLNALRHPKVQVFGHPTARLIQRRKPIAMDMDAVISEAARLGVALELNSSPHRLDLKDTHLRLARERGVKIVIDTDAHRTTELDQMQHGVEQARRAGLEREHVWNALPREEFLRRLRR